MARLRGQDGYLYAKGGFWRGRFRSYSVNGKARRHSVSLGRVSEVPEQTAREQLVEIISHDGRQSAALDAIGSQSLICPRPSTRLNESERVRPGSRGAISELLVAVDLANKGYTVYRPIDPCAPCDLLVMASDWKVLRVEVKTARVLDSGMVLCDLRRQVGCFDLIAFVFADQIEYRKPSEISHLLFPLQVKMPKQAGDSVHTDSISETPGVANTEAEPL